MNSKLISNTYKTFLDLVIKVNLRLDKPIDLSIMTNDLMDITISYLNFFSKIENILKDNYSLQYVSKTSEVKRNYINEILTFNNEKHCFSYSFYDNILNIGGFAKYSEKFNKFTFSSSHAVLSNSYTESFRDKGVKFEIYNSIEEHIEKSIENYVSNNTKTLKYITEKLYNLNTLIEPIYNNTFDYWNSFFSPTKTYHIKDIIKTLESMNDFILLNSDISIKDHISDFERKQNHIYKIKKILNK